MRRETACFSMYSDMSMRTIASCESNMNSASARASSVLPTPVGPKKRNDPIGRLGSLSPARLLRMALATGETASSCPTPPLRPPALGEGGLEPNQLLHFALHESRHGHARPAAHPFGDVLGIALLL